MEKVEHEICISELIYSLHGTDTYEELFRDNVPNLQDKRTGIVEAIESLEEYNSVNCYLGSDVSDISYVSD